MYRPTAIATTEDKIEIITLKINPIALISLGCRELQHPSNRS
ncbi:MAG: hypothetical protein QNJ32_03650 [Xenococcaceae cyanobacterium MO_167.B27]|nr:hypothetical protein [Xenococcaceae cyanobacterium MO_167.B27]